MRRRVGRTNAARVRSRLAACWPKTCTRPQFPGSSASRSASCFTLLPVNTLSHLHRHSRVTSYRSRTVAFLSFRRALRLAPAVRGASSFEESPHIATESDPHGRTSEAARLQPTRAASENLFSRRDVVKCFVTRLQKKFAKHLGFLPNSRPRLAHEERRSSCHIVPHSQRRANHTPRRPETQSPRSCLSMR